MKDEAGVGFLAGAADTVGFEFILGSSLMAAASIGFTSCLIGGFDSILGAETGALGIGPARRSLLRTYGLDIVPYTLLELGASPVVDS